MSKRRDREASRRSLLDVVPAWFLSPIAPKVAVPALIGSFWVFEAFVHMFVFQEGTSLADELIRPTPHEVWMRSVVAFFIVLLGVAWYIVATERRRRLEVMTRYQSRLQDMAGRLAYAETEERRELARRLHEDIGQQVTAARMFAETCECEAAGEPSQTVSRILGRTVNEIRELSEELSPPALEQYGLAAALESFAARITRRGDVTVDFEAEGSSDRLGRDATRVVFQVLTEIVESATFVEGVTRVSIELCEHACSLTMTVGWDGPREGDYFSAGERIANVGGKMSVVADADGSLFIVTFGGR